MTGGDADEVNVDELARDRIDLELFDHRLTFFLGALELEQKDGVLTSILLENLSDGQIVDRDGDRRFVAAIDDGRDPALCTKTSSGVGPLFLALVDDQGDISGFDCRCHSRCLLTHNPGPVSVVFGQGSNK